MCLVWDRPPHFCYSLPSFTLHCSYSLPLYSYVLLSLLLPPFLNNLRIISHCHLHEVQVQCPWWWHQGRYHERGKLYFCICITVASCGIQAHHVFRCGGTRMMCMPCVPALQSCYSFPLNTVLAMGDACPEMHVLCKCVGVGVNEWWNVPNVLNMPWWLCITCSVMYLSVAGCPWVSKVQRWTGQSCTGEPRGGRGRRVCCDEAWHCLLRRTAAWGVPWVAAGWSLTGQSVALCCTLWHTRVAVAVCILTLTTLPSSHRLIFWLSLDHPSKWDQWHWCPVSLECADCNHECSRRSLQASLLWTLCVLTHCMPL